jgi:HNH endonuclease
VNIKKFETFLRESGAEILAPTNPYELVRFRTVNGVSIVYTSNRGRNTFTNEAGEAFEKFCKRSIWQIVRRSDKQLEAIKAQILARDGDACFYCAKPTTAGQNRTVEHILSIAHGGNNHLANLVFAHEECNAAAGSMTVIEKVKYRDTLRGNA